MALRSRTTRNGGRAPYRRFIDAALMEAITGRQFVGEKCPSIWPPGRQLQAGDYRRDLSIFSGVSHPGVDGGHAGEKSFLTAAPHPGSGTFRNSVSLDQVAAERLGNLTRIPALITHVGIAMKTLSYTRSGVAIPPERSVSALYRRMFVQGSANEVNARVHDLNRGKSVLDFVNDSAKRLQRDLGPQDRDRLDQYFTSVRDLEARLHESAEWERRPKPVVRVPEPVDVAVDQRRKDRLDAESIQPVFATDMSRACNHFCRYSHTKPVWSSCMNSVRWLYSLPNSSFALVRWASVAVVELSASEAFLTASCQVVSFFLNSAWLRPFAGEMRLTESPTRMSSLPSPLTSSTQIRVAVIGPVSSSSRRGCPYGMRGPGSISGRNGLSLGSLPLPATFSAHCTPPSLDPLSTSRSPSPSQSMTNGSLCPPVIRNGSVPALICSGLGLNLPLPSPLNQ
jgi:hypothetical protein